MNRRKFLTKTALFGAGLTIPIGVRSWMSYSLAQPQPSSQRLIVVFLRGAIDGLSVLVPYSDENYYQARPNLAVESSLNDSGELFDLDGKFGLHPALKDLMPLWQEKSLAFINCCGFANNNRSHFALQHIMETGMPDDSSSEGWMNRLLGIISQNNPTQAINMGTSTKRIFMGQNSVANIPRQNNNNSQKLEFVKENQKLNRLFGQLYNNTDELSKTYQQGQQARQLLIQELEEEMVIASQDAPRSSIAFIKEATLIAKLMKGKANSQLAFLDFGRWDTHTNQSRTLSKLLPSVGLGLATLKKELGNEYKNTTIVVMSEFGRTVKENENRGTDHGYGNAMWVLGGNVKGGKIYGKWQGLDSSQLYKGREIPVNTDYREVIADVLTNNFQLDKNSLFQVFPDFRYQPKFSVV